jgi:hypothetical protein
MDKIRAEKLTDVEKTLTTGHASLGKEVMTYLLEQVLDKYP